MKLATVNFFCKNNLYCLEFHSLNGYCAVAYGSMAVYIILLLIENDFRELIVEVYFGCKAKLNMFNLNRTLTRRV